MLLPSGREKGRISPIHLKMETGLNSFRGVQTRKLEWSDRIPPGVTGSLRARPLAFRQIVLRHIRTTPFWWAEYHRIDEETLQMLDHVWDSDTTVIIEVVCILTRRTSESWDELAKKVTEGHPPD